MTPFISAKDLVLDFPTYTADRSLKRSIFKAATGGKIANDSSSKVSVRALDKLNFEIKAGDRVGLYGHNGSGKTTLLRAITGAYPPTAGFLRVHGRVASLLDISMGMDGDASGWDNIILRGLMMGMSLHEIKAKSNQIAEFSELGGYLDMPLRTYSSGMQVRLAFSVSTAITADILLFDEWLSVGDEDFQKKASDKLHDLINNASIMMIASHSYDLLKGVCTKIFRMERGSLIDITSVDYL